AGVKRPRQPTALDDSECAAVPGDVADADAMGVNCEALQRRLHVANPLSASRAGATYSRYLLLLITSVAAYGVPRSFPKAGRDRVGRVPPHCLAPRLEFRRRRRTRTVYSAKV